MKPLQRLVVVGSDANYVRELIADRKEDQFVCERIADNVEGPTPQFDRERFWYVLLGCLMTTQQRSTTGSPVDRFLDVKAFSLTLTDNGRTSDARLCRCTQIQSPARAGRCLHERRPSNWNARRQRRDRQRREGSAEDLGCRLSGYPLRCRAELGRQVSPK